MFNERLLENKLGNTLDNIIAIVPSLDDELLLKLLERIHFKNEKNKISEVLIKLLNLIVINPYNAYKLTDAIFLLLVNNIQPRQYFEHPLLDCEITIKSQTTCGQSSILYENLACQ